MPDFGNFAHVWLHPIGSILPIRCSWCRCAARYTLTRESVDGNQYVDSVCDSHANEWAGFQEGEQMEIEFNGH